MGRGLLFALPLALYVFALMEPSKPSDIVAFLFVWMAAGFLVWIPYLPIALDSERLKNDRAIAECVATLSNLRIPASIPAVIEARRFGSRTSQTVTRCLPALLGSLTREHYGQIPRLTACLCDAFFAATDNDSKRAILQALGRAGDGYSADRLERNKRYQPIEVQGWIEEALVILRERRKKEQHAERLLRPSNLPGPDHLLRPATAGEVVPEMLLRPVADYCQTHFLRINEEN
jgi:hypothetical protein